MNVHRITPDMLINKPTFGMVAKEIYEFIGDADLAGYNSDRFDVPMLMEELYRAGYEFSIENRNLIDVQKIFYKMEPRTLKAAYNLYCGKELEEAHDALADVRATIEVLKGQLDKYEGVNYEDGDGFIIEAPIKNDVGEISKFLNERNNNLDATMRLRYDHTGEVVFNFGKYIGQPAAKILYEDRQYLNWILEKDFSVQVKQIVKKIVKEYAQSLKKSETS
jgi:DNA polymerase-3 subunit epsilon